jgi:NAD(P)-dependent dehydrogenase (short-subunit alcohol dehydrogenase family)
MITHVATITGGSHRLGRAMTFGLAREGYAVVAGDRIAVDIAQLASEIVDTPLAERGVPILADLRLPAECDRVMAATREHFRAVHILIDNVGLTLTYIWPDLYCCPPPPLFWEAADEIAQNVIDTNYVAADQMARRLALHMVSQGWARIVNVTTNLDTMNRLTSGIYGASKTALEMATEIWAKGTTATGLAINIVDPGAGADASAMAEEIRDASRKGRIAPLLESGQMLPPVLWAISPDANNVNGYASTQIFGIRGCRLPRPLDALAVRTGLTLHATLNA